MLCAEKRTGNLEFSHGWPLSADSWEAQMVFLASNGYRCIAHDRRGHGRSSQPWSGNEMDTYADDLAELIETPDLKGAVLISFSVPGLPGCWSQGATEAETLANIRDAIHDYLVVRDELIQGAEVREVEVA